MNSIIKLTLKPDLILKPWIRLESGIMYNDLVPESFLIKIKEILPDEFLHRDVRLMKKYPNHINWNEVYNYSDDEHVDLIIERFNKDPHNVDFLTKNKNPRIVSYLLKHYKTVSNYVGHAYYLSTMAQNSNPGLTDHIRENWDKLPSKKFLNKNPGLYDLMVPKSKQDFYLLSERSEEYFTDLLRKNWNKLKVGFKKLIGIMTI